MNYIFIIVLAILIIGLSGIIAQVLLLRELLVSFYGNELTLGIILANWIILEALGVFIFGKVVERIKNKINAFINLEIIFSLMLPFCIYLSRTFKNILGVGFGETIGLYTIFYASFFIILPLSFCHGALFSTTCKIHSLYIKKSTVSIGKVYTLETMGTILGGLFLTYLLIPYLNSFQIVFIISITNLVLCLFFFPSIGKISKYIVLSFIILMSLFCFNGGINYLQKLSLNKQWKPEQVLEYRNSIYGNMAVTKRQGQYTFFYNGIPTITTPYPDITFVQEFGNLPLLFSKDPKDIFIISAGAGGLINEILKHPVRRVDYAELDPLIIELLKKYPSALTERELTDPRINIINLDGRFFIKNTNNRYDIVLIGLSSPQDLSTNRLFTQEFFSLVHKRLNQDGVLALCLPGSLAYLSQELKDLNACILNGLKATYAYVRIIPGDYNIFLASSSKDILEVNPDLITRRLRQQTIKTDILVPGYLEYRLSRRWIDWFQHSLVGATKKTNQDLRPFGVFQMLMLWNKQFSPKLSYIFGSLSNLNIGILAALILGITLVLFSFLQLRRSKKMVIAYSIATTGFFGMLSNLILIFSFQVFYGYLYYRIGLLMSIFMAGIALGSILATKFIERMKNSLSLFIKLEVIIAVFSLVLPLAINELGGLGYGIFISLFFIPGLLMGIEFPIASKIYLGENEHIGYTVGILYSSDLVGGWFAGILGGILLLPVLGLFDSSMIMVILKASSILLILAAKRLFKQEDPSAHCLRIKDEFH